MLITHLCKVCTDERLLHADPYCDWYKELLIRLLQLISSCREQLYTTELLTVHFSLFLAIPVTGKRRILVIPSELSLSSRRATNLTSCLEVADTIDKWKWQRNGKRRKYRKWKLSVSQEKRITVNFGDFRKFLIERRALSGFAVFKFGRKINRHQRRKRLWQIHSYWFFDIYCSIIENTMLDVWRIFQWKMPMSWKMPIIRKVSDECTKFGKKSNL